MSDATARATDVIGNVSGLSAEECEEIAAALERAALLATALDGEVDVSASQEWVMIPASQVREEWRAYSPARGMAVVETGLGAALDEVDGQLSLTDEDPGHFGTESDWRVESRYVSDWLPVDTDQVEGADL